MFASRPLTWLPTFCCHLLCSAHHTGAAGQHQLCQGVGLLLRQSDVHTTPVATHPIAPVAVHVLATMHPAALPPQAYPLPATHSASRSTHLQISCGSVQTSTELFGMSGAYQGADKHSELNRFVIANEKK